MEFAVSMPRSLAGWAVFALGALLLFIGLVLFIGGVWLAVVGGSWYYLLAGAGLIVASWPLMMRRPAGAWIYIAVFLFTLLWALWEVGLNGWALVPRLVGPLVLLLLVILSFPVLHHASGRKWALIGGLGWLGFVVVGGFIVAQANRPAAPGEMPASIAGMSDPSLLQIGADWPAYAGAYAARRYSPLGQITPENVEGLERAWVYRTGDTPEEDYGAETTPIKVGDTLYLCSSRNILIALDAATGREIWRHDPQVSNDYIPYTAACRGVAYHETPAAADGCAARIIEGTLDARLIAVDARTGQRCSGFGQNGEVDITVGMGEVIPGM